MKKPELLGMRSSENSIVLSFIDFLNDTLSYSEFEIILSEKEYCKIMNCFPYYRDAIFHDLVNLAVKTYYWSVSEILKKFSDFRASNG